MKSFISAIVAYVGSRVLFALFGFHYNLFGEPFNAGKLVLDIGVFVGIFFGAYWLMGRFRLLGTKDGG